MREREDLGYVFSCIVYRRLKEVILGRVFTRVEDDSLYVEIRRRDEPTFKLSIDDISNKIVNGYTSEYATFEVLKKYKKFVYNRYFMEPKTEDLV